MSLNSFVLLIFLSRGIEKFGYKASASLGAEKTLNISQGNKLYLNKKKKHRHIEFKLEFKAMIKRTSGSDIVSIKSKFLCFLPIF